METNVIEFKTAKEYGDWLAVMGSSVRIINTSTTKSWSLWFGFLGDNKTYTVTYQQRKPLTNDQQNRLDALKHPDKFGKLVAAIDLTRLFQK